MKNNLIGAIAGWKSAALLALVAMVAAVAFSGVLSTTQIADAQNAGGEGSPGETVTVNFSSVTGGTATTPSRFRISPDSDGSATFSNGAQSISCYPDSAAGCDASTSAGVQLRVTIDADSALGSIFVQHVTRSGGSFIVASGDEVTISVKPANPPVALRAYGSPPAAAITASVPADGTDVTLAVGTVGTVIGAQLVDARGAGVAGTTILVSTTRGVLNSSHVPTTTPVTTCANHSACTLTTQVVEPDDNDDTTTEEPAGRVQVRLVGNGATGNAEVTFRELRTGLSHTVTVILHGPAASISAAPDQSTIGGGGSTFIVVTVLDAEGNPAVGVTDISYVTHKPLVPAIIGPEVPAGSSAISLDTSVTTEDRLALGHPLYLPSCGARAAVLDDTSTTDVNEAVPGSNGTNTAGKCVLKVSARGGATPSPADDSTRGTHTLTLGTGSPLIPTATVEIQVGGAPASIETDAPASVDSLSSTSITVTVLDDEGVRVGAVPISVVKVEGSGNVDDVAGDMTSDGRGTFTYLAPLTPGEAVFLIRAGGPGQTIQDTVTLAIGEVAPEAPDATWNNDLVSGQNLVVWNGADGADPSDGAAEGVSAIWSYNTGSGSWDGYFPSAADVPGGNTLSSLGNGQAYVVIVE